MKHRLNRLYKVLTFTALLTFCLSASGEEPVDQRERISALDDLRLIEMINSVETGKTTDLVQKFQEKEGRTQLVNGKFGPNSGCNVESLRNREVLLVTIPASKLFGPNSRELLPTASVYLTPFRRYLKDPDMYRVLLVMHTDNTGDEQYRSELTSARADAVFDWFVRSGSDTRYLFPYSLADDMPLKPNDSVEARSTNRRLEIYLVPGTKMIEQAKKGRIAF